MRYLLIFPLFILLSSFFIFFWWNSVSSPSKPQDKETRKFLIVKGEAAGKIAKKLESAGLIKSELAFRLYTQLSGREKSIQAGNYELSPNLALKEIIKALVAGPKEVWVTYPEGLRREEIAQKTVKALDIEKDKTTTFLQEFLQESEGQEGFLFPETYLFPKDVTAKKVIAKLRSTFDTKVSEKIISDAKASGSTIKEVIILASVIERETITDEERPVVAGILLKRLDAGWPLQADATLQYAIANAKCQISNIKCDWWQPPTAEQKSLKSPYSTYTNKGLPPSPIANPGNSSIKAVVYPEDSPYWYYLHDSEGKIHYAKSLEEHNQNIARYLR